MTTKKDNKEITKVDKVQNLLPSKLNVANLDDLLTVLTHIAKAGTNNTFTTKESIFALFVRSKELGIGIGAAMEHMHNINGKTGADVHILKALLLKAGTIIWEKTEDFVPLHEYADSNKQTWTLEEIIKEHGKNWRVANTKEEVEKAKAKNLPYYAFLRENWRTSYVFTREITLNSGKTHNLVVNSSFSWVEALAAQLPTDKNNQLNSNSNWQKYRKVMLDHRAFTFGAREIGADYLLGLYSTEELFDMNNIQYEYNDESVVTLRDKDGNIIKTETQKD